jgi:hypothetical protein
VPREASLHKPVFLFLCLSRACLGILIVVMEKWPPKGVSRTCAPATASYLTKKRSRHARCSGRKPRASAAGAITRQFTSAIMLAAIDGASALTAMSVVG